MMECVWEGEISLVCACVYQVSVEQIHDLGVTLCNGGLQGRTLTRRLRHSVHIDVMLYQQQSHDIRVPLVAGHDQRCDSIIRPRLVDVRVTVRVRVYVCMCGVCVWCMCVCVCVCGGGLTP